MFLKNISESFSLLFQFQNILATFFGVILGQWMGAIPGLTSSMAIALLIPFTYSLPSWTAIIMLVSIYQGGTFGDSAPAILINTPGMPSAAAMLLDGYPLALQGKGGKALYMSLYASITGSIFAVFCLAFSTPLLAKAALLFGPAEFASLILFAMTMVAGISGESIIKGIISAVFGVLLSTIGMDSITSTPRLIFNNINLLEGLPYLPILIGLLAMSEVLNQLEMPNAGDDIKIIDPSASSYEDSRLSWNEYKKYFMSILRGSVIGTIIGALPGLGCSVATFLGYNQEKALSKYPEKFGKGAIEGVASPGAANSAVSCATLIPLFTFGIPGDAVAAILMGALMIHGISPGPKIFVENAVTMYTIILGLFFAGIVNLLTGLYFIRISVKVLQINKRILYPIVLVCAIIGSYSFRGNIFDVKAMMVAGFFGYIMTKYGFNKISLIIGFILGPIFENWFTKALIISGNNLLIFVKKPLSLLFLISTIIILYFLNKQRKNVIF